MGRLSKIINYPLGLMGLKLSRLKNEQGHFNLLQDIDADDQFQEIYQKIKIYTMVEPERCYALYQSVRYILQKNIPGDFAECGVWKGGSVMMIAYMLIQAGITDRKIYCYDTFEGMTKPGEKDGEKEKEIWEKFRISDQSSNWCRSSQDEVENNIRRTNYPIDNFIFVQGKVEDTIPGTLPGQLALLRLDTDWYESTRHELLHLYPLLQKGGILIIDDYGAWPGAKKAVDEYFEANGPVYLNRIDFTGRLVIK